MLYPVRDGAPYVGRLHLLLQDVSPVRESTPFFRGICLRVNLTKTGKRP